MEPDALAQVLCQLPEFYDPNLLVGFETSDDAAVYQISDSHAMIQTVDIFPGVQHLLHLKSKSKILRPIEIMGFFYEFFCQIQGNNLL